MENIFAAGDVAEAFDIATEGQMIDALWTSAVQQAHCPGLNMTGKTMPDDGTVWMNLRIINDIPLYCNGITFPKETLQQIKF